MLWGPWSWGMTQVKEPLGLQLIPKLKRKCPPDTSLTCTWGPMVRRETRLKLLWSSDLDHPTEGWRKSRVRTSRPPLRAAYSLLQSFQPFSIILDTVQVKGGPIHWLFVFRIKPLLATQFWLGNLIPYTFVWSSDCCSNCAENEHMHCYPGPALPGKNSTALHCEIHRIANENLLGTFAITLSIY